MSLNSVFSRIIIKLKSILIYYLFQYPRILKYMLLSNSKKIIGKAIYNQPAQLSGNGIIMFGENVNIGINISPYFYNGCCYIDARNKESVIEMGDDIWINNNCIIISEGAGIKIGNKTLLGLNVEIIDSDFHDLNPLKRFGGKINMAKIVIEENVFIGNNVKILKGVTIGENSIIANGSVVTKSISKNTIVGGNPAKEIRKLVY